MSRSEIHQPNDEKRIVVDQLISFIKELHIKAPEKASLSKIKEAYEQKKSLVFVSNHMFHGDSLIFFLHVYKSLQIQQKLTAVASHRLFDEYYHEVIENMIRAGALSDNDREMYRNMYDFHKIELVAERQLMHSFAEYFGVELLPTIQAHYLGKAGEGKLSSDAFPVQRYGIELFKRRIDHQLTTQSLTLLYPEGTRSEQGMKKAQQIFDAEPFRSCDPEQVYLLLLALSGRPEKSAFPNFSYPMSITIADQGSFAAFQSRTNNLSVTDTMMSTIALFLKEEERGYYGSLIQNALPTGDNS